MKSLLARLFPCAMCCLLLTFMTSSPERLRWTKQINLKRSGCGLKPGDDSRVAS